MNLYQYFKALSLSDDKMANTVTISEDRVRNLASITYNQLASQFSWNIPYMLDARGLILDMETGAIVARPYPKFFNYGENEYAYWPENVGNLTVEEKLDGSLFIISTYKDELIVASSGSLTSEHAELFSKYLKTHLTEEQQNYLFELGKTYTILGEYVGPENKVVLTYDKENMILHGLIETHQDESTPIVEMDYTELQVVGQNLGMDVVKQYSVNSFEDINNLILSSKGIEGFVVKFENGHRLKFKTDEYVRLHRIATDLDLTIDSKKLRESFVINIINETYDDLIPFLSKETNALLHTMLDDAKSFMAMAIKKKESYLKQNRHLETSNVVDMNAIRHTIKDLVVDIKNINKDFESEVDKYLSTIDDSSLLEKGYSRINQILNKKSADEKTTIKRYTKTNKKNGLINTQELSRKQKELVVQSEDESILDSHIKKYLFGSDLLTQTSSYLTEVYVKNVELALKQRIQIQLNDIARISPTLFKLNVSPKLQKQTQVLINNINKELESQITDNKIKYSSFEVLWALVALLLAGPYLYIIFTYVIPFLNNLFN